MATRRRGAASLDDLKAKLGYTEPSADNPAVDGDAAAVDETAGDDDGDGDAASVGASGLGASRLGAPAGTGASTAARGSAAPPNDEDYSDAISEADAHQTYEYDPNAVDPSIKAPVGKPLVATLIAAAVALVIGVLIGGIGVANNTVRKLENASIADAQRMLDVVRPVSTTLTAIEADLAGIPAETTYSPQFEERLRAAYGDTRPQLDPTLIANAKTLMVRNERLGRQLVEYAIATSFLGSVVDRHLRATQVDAEEIQRLEAGIADTANYAVAIEFETLFNRFQAFMQDPAANPFQPIVAERVTYENLEMSVQGEGDSRREYYTVRTATGEALQVLIHDLVLLPRDQLLPPVSSENALDRYRNRAAQIKELSAQAVALQAALLTGLEDVANTPTYFTF